MVVACNAESAWRGVAKNVPDERLIEIEEAEAALREGIERVKELVSEARQIMRPREPAEPEPPDPARPAIALPPVDR
jgi:hypothetical protein